MLKAIDEYKGDSFHVYNADCVEIASKLPDNSIGFSIYSPPFSSLYTYSNSDRDMGNTKDHNEFFNQYKFLIKEKLRITKPGRLTAVHCMNLPTTKGRDGFIGMYDFRGEIIRAHIEAGWIYHSEICVWKDPVLAMQRTKARGLLHKTVREDSSMSRQGIPDHIVVFRKPGDNDTPIEGEFKYYVGEQDLNEYIAREAPDSVSGQKFIERICEDGRIRQGRSTGSSIDVWQHYASPVWFDINQTNTLQFKAARDSEDERHICPLQLDVIERCNQLWSMPDDVVFSPFLGIGSEGYVALQMGRKFIGTELKPSYFKLACKNLDKAQNQEKQTELF
jgi:DNA modification methylase